jgi:23S rRNA (cytosine1962-C5)-methyltransferase
MRDSVRLSAEACSFVEGGGRDIELGRLALDAPLAAGAHVRLLDADGEEAGLAIADPENQRLRVMATPADGFAKIDGALLGWRIERAVALRRAFGLGAPGQAYRVLHGAGDGVPGFACDVLGPVAVLYVYAEALVPLGRLVADAVRGFARLDGVALKLRARGGAADVTPGVRGELVGAVPERVVAHEGEVPFEIHPTGGLNHGLFTDMREQRRGLARFAGGRSVLNLFSYTGALSVACARAGAARVTSVDTSDGVQAWARQNFTLSGLDPADRRYAFEVGDAIRFLARGARERERYDVVLIDPPTFSTARGQPWSLDRHYPDLIAQACEVVAPGGLVWLAANTHELGSLSRLAQKGLRKAGRPAAMLEQGGLPPDYPTVPAQPKDRYLQTVLLRLE